MSLPIHPLEFEPEEYDPIKRTNIHDEIRSYMFDFVLFTVVCSITGLIAVTTYAYAKIILTQG